MTYPPIEPFEHGSLGVGDGNAIYWELCGNPAGQPAVVLHGGPGSGCAPGWRQYFDPQRYRVVLFDQRGCGRSVPHASDPGVDLSVNTTSHLVADIERLRAHLGVDRWLVLGGSWGSTLGLTYAVQHPERVTALVFFAVTTTRASDVEWFTRTVGRYFPEAFERFVGVVPPAERHGNLAAAYARLLASPDPAVRHWAAQEWCRWEDAIAYLGEEQRSARFADPSFRYGFARLVTHYFANAAFQADDAILGQLHRLAGIPGVLVHGRLDIAGPVDTAWQLARGWADAELVIVPKVGHAGSDAMNQAVVEALDRFARETQHPGPA